MLSDRGPPFTPERSTPEIDLGKQVGNPIDPFPTPAQSQLGSPLRSPISITTPSSLNLQSVTQKGDLDRIQNINSKQFEVQRFLIESGLAADIHHVNTVAVGGQSCAKSSLLSLMSGIPLSVAGKIATHGPTQVFTYHLDETSCKIQILLDHNREVIDFAANLCSEVEIREAAMLAGHEARRCGKGFQVIRSYDSLKLMTSKERMIGSENWDTFTENVVVITATGRHLKNLAMIDLPGINMENARLEALIKRYISRPENLIILCVPAGGADHSTAFPDVKLVKAADPTGARTIGFVTKADQILEASESSAVDIITKTNPNFAEFHPRYEWWPVCLLQGAAAARFDVETMFQRQGWPEVEKLVNRKFGLAEARMRILDIFEGLVTDNFGNIQDVFNKRLEENEATLNELPAPIAKPIAALHNTIYDVILRLRQIVLNPPGSDHKEESGNEHEKQLGELQVKMEEDIFNSVTEFRPYREGTEGAEETYEVPAPAASWSPYKRVYIDVIHQDVKRYTSPRRKEVDKPALISSYHLEHIKRWREIATAHVESVWSVLYDAIELALQTEVGHCKRLCEKFKHHLHHEASRHKSMIIAKANERCDRLMTSPVLLCEPGRINEEDKAAKIQHFTQQFGLLYPTRDLDELFPSPEWGPTDIATCIEIQASLTIKLYESAENVWFLSEDIQGQVVDYLDFKTLSATLREGFELDNIHGEKIIKRCRDLFEEDPGIQRERERYEMKRRQLHSIRDKIEQLSEL